MLDVNRLKVFRAVVASGSVQAAATHLGYTSSAVSQHLGALQRETGLTLFEWSGRGISPTAAGRLLASESEELMGSLARLGGVVDDLREGRTGKVSIGSFASAGEIWLPQVAKVLRREFPDVLLTVALNEYERGRARGGPEIDIRTESTTDDPLSLPGYRRHPLLDEPYRLMLPHDHPLAGRDEILMAELAGESWVDDDQSDSTCGVIMRTAWRSAGYSPRFAARSADHHATKAFVAAGIGIALMPCLALEPVPPEVAVVRVVDPEPRRLVTAFVREGADCNPAVRRVVELLGQLAGSAGNPPSRRVPRGLTVHP